MQNIYYFSTNSTKYGSFELPPQEFKTLDETKIKYGEKVSADWPKITLEFENNKKRIPDFPYFCPIFPIFSERAVDALHDLIAPYVEFLPVEVTNSEKKFVGVNVWTIYDMLDLPRCEYRDRSLIGIVNPINYAFKDDVLPDAPIFRVKETRNIKIFVSQEFRDIVESKRLTGLQFDRLMNIRVDYLAQE